MLALILILKKKTKYNLPRLADSETQILAAVLSVHSLVLCKQINLQKIVSKVLSSRDGYT